MKVLSFCPSSAVSASLPGLIIFFIIYHIHKLESAQFRVTGPDHPVTARMGEAIVLPCYLSPRMSAENMEVRWFRSEFTSVVHQYHEGKDQYGKQMPDYHERTELLKAGIMNGNVSLQILNIRLSDEGQYSCFVQDGPFYEEALLELKVAGLGSAPLISVEGHQDGGIRVVCRSAGWYPEPEVLWKDFNQRHLPSLSEAKSQGDNSLFETETAIIVTEHSNQNLSCCIRNTILNQERESAVYIAAPSTFGLVWRKCYISDSSKEEEGATEGNPLAQPLMDMPEPDPKDLVTHSDEHGGLSLSTPLEVEGDCGSGESPVDKVNGKDDAQLDDASLEAFENLHIGSPVGVNILCVSCFCSCLRHRSQDEKDKMEE